MDEVLEGPRAGKLQAGRADRLRGAMVPALGQARGWGFTNTVWPNAGGRCHWLHCTDEETGSKGVPSHLPSAIAPSTGDPSPKAILGIGLPVRDSWGEASVAGVLVSIGQAQLL